MKDKLELRFGELLKNICEYNPDADIELVKKAFEFAKVAHTGEKRLSGDDFIMHPLETAAILASWQMDQATIISGLLHDTVEHGAATRKDVLENFGDEILTMIDGVTETSKVKLKGSSDEIFIENLRKMFLAMARDLRIVFIRLAERIDNLKSLQYLPEDRKKAYAIDSLEIYAPLSERLGMWKVKSQIDDLAFQYAYPEDYQKVKEISSGFYKKVEERIDKMIKKLYVEFNKENIKANIYGRKKGLYSLYSKLKRSDIAWDIMRIHDIVALRIITTSVKDCYIALGILHKFYKPVPFLPLSDYIALPKPNGYRSIHSKVFGPEGNVIEVQIRTDEMHSQAEQGAAAHWQMTLLKSKGKLSSDDIDEGKFKVASKLDWVKQLAEWQGSIKDSDEFLKAVKFDVLSRRIFVFTPNGDVFDLPERATPIDFAYAVHTSFGYYIKGAKVNEKIVPLDYILKNGEVVEILKTKNPQKPNNGWLEFAVTTLARREIKKQLRKEVSMN